MPSDKAIPLRVLKDAEWAMQICNACRYCEGFCAVFPAMEKRLSFKVQDLTYLANLCHDCRECLYSCQYAPPHEFGLNLPKTLAEFRRETYRAAAWPAFMTRVLGRTGPALAFSLLAAPGLFFLGASLAGEPGGLFAAHPVSEGSFYRIVSHGALVGGFSLVGAAVLLALAMGFRNFWVQSGGTSGSWFDPGAIGRALRDSLSLRYLGGDGSGCAYPDERASLARRRYHHLTFYGFLLCFASTTTAAIYHNFLGWEAPYALSSLPVILGVAGGAGLIVGPLGLLRLKAVRDPEGSDPSQLGMDLAFLVLLLLSSATGLLLLALRETSAMGALLLVHLGLVAGLLLTMPYGKFVHGIYRFGALIRFAKEKDGP